LFLAEIIGVAAKMMESNRENQSLEELDIAEMVLFELQTITSK
jgi:hypothetical protein